MKQRDRDRSSQGMEDQLAVASKLKSTKIMITVYSLITV